MFVLLAYVILWDGLVSLHSLPLVFPMIVYIRLRGRWTSDAYQVYLRKNPSILFAQFLILRYLDVSLLLLYYQLHFYELGRLLSFLLYYQLWVSVLGRHLLPLVLLYTLYLYLTLLFLFISLLFSLTFFSLLQAHCSEI